ncbi:helix-turn-helix domain-containing protein [Tunicatimonas pelagia]|uniref:helix-turn-helix domain-containing protein n=1 Tax=Tunicatimonas pelagia TaxID=931531 RepID=UPI00266687B2|nr:helix-turn-helix transcriptional regulator [Tunicatimonas pelagia]WKN44896.1 helix-turn-helix transcriptional regulator [Tunicatimonas pelagia]
MAQKKGSTVAKEQKVKLTQLGKRIKQLRIKNGYTNAEYFAYDHEIARTQYARYEQGEDLRVSTLIKIVKAFDMSLAEFFSEGFED